MVYGILPFNVYIYIYIYATIVQMLYYLLTVHLTKYITVTWALGELSPLDPDKLCLWL